MFTDDCNKLLRCVMEGKKTNEYKQKYPQRGEFLFSCSPCPGFGCDFGCLFGCLFVCLFGCLFVMVFDCLYICLFVIDKTMVGKKPGFPNKNQPSGFLFWFFGLF